MSRLYKGIPFFSFTSKTSNNVFIEKIYTPFGAVAPLYLKTYVPNSENKKNSLDLYNSKLIEKLKNHNELIIKNDELYLAENKRYMGKIKNLAKFIIDNNLISLDVVSPGCHLVEEKAPSCTKAILGFNHKTRRWHAYIDGEVISIGIGDEILLVKDNTTIKLTTSLDVRKVIEIFAIGKINSMVEHINRIIEE